MNHQKMNSRGFNAIHLCCTTGRSIMAERVSTPTSMDGWWRAPQRLINGADWRMVKGPSWPTKMQTECTLTGLPASRTTKSMAMRCTPWETRTTTITTKFAFPPHSLQRRGTRVANAAVASARRAAIQIQEESPSVNQLLAGLVRTRERAWHGLLGFARNLAKYAPQVQVEGLHQRQVSGWIVRSISLRQWNGIPLLHVLNYMIYS